MSVEEVVPGLAKSPTQRSRWRRLFGRLMLLSLLTLLACVWFAPKLLTQPNVKSRALAWALDGQPIRIDFGSAALDWLQPVVLNDVTVKSVDDRPLLSVREIRSERTLWQLVSQRDSLGKFIVTEPILQVILRDGGSNIEDLLAAIPASSSSDASPEMTLELVKSQIDFEHSAAKRKSRLSNLDCKLVVTQKGLSRLVAEMPSKGDDAKNSTERFALLFGEQSDSEGTNSQPSPQITATPIQQTAATSTTAVGQKFLFRAKDWQLDWLNPIVARWHPDGEIHGRLNGDLKISLADQEAVANGDVSGQGDLSIRELVVAGLNGMKSDRLQLSEVTASGEVTTKNQRVVLNGAELKTEIGNLIASGDLPLSGWSFESLEQAIQKLGTESFRVEGQIDLAKLAALLPQTLAIREGTEITGGSIKAILLGQPKDGASRLAGKATMASLTAVSDGKRIEWNTPLEAVLVLRHDGKQLVYERVTARSDFLQAEASGTLTDATLKANADLQRLHQNLNRFFDWGVDRLSGQLVLEGQIQQRDHDEVLLNATATLDEFELHRRDELPWREPRLQLGIASTATRSDSGDASLQRIKTATLRLNSGSDRLDAKLLKPMEWKSSDRWQAEADVAGQLASWQARLRPMISIPAWQLTGQIDAKATISSEANTISVSDLVATIEQLRAQGPDIVVQDPKVTVTTTGTWDLAKQRWVSPQLELVSQTAGLNARDLDVVLSGANLSARGDVQFRVRLGNVSRWLIEAQTQPSWHFAGDATGSLRLEQNNGICSAKLNAQVQKFAIATPTGQPQPAWETAWLEESLQLVSDATFDPAKQSLRLAETKLIADGLEIAMSGQVDDVSTTPLVDLAGELAYDWDRLTSRLGESLRRNVQLAGRDRRKFFARGRLPNSMEMATLSGEAGIGWHSAQAYGLTLSHGDIAGKLQDGVGQLTMTDVSVSEGVVRFSSQLQLNQVPSQLVLPKATVIEKVRLSPELCAGWLKFVAPALADATRVDGRFSMTLAGGPIPLLTPTTGDVSGRLEIHESQILPGPLATQIIGVIDQIKVLTKTGTASAADRQRVWVTLPEQQVPFRLVQGRVHHEGLTLVTKEAVLKTRGSVGLDESLDLTIEIPVRDEWLRSNKFLSSLRGQSLSVPVRGTLTRPQVDPKLFERLAREATTGAVENLLDQELQKGLKKFLPGKK